MSILLIDKPSGITSFDVIRKLRRQLGIRKMGHAGTLDPLATGLLIIATEKDTKRISEFMGLPKEYEVLIEFGKTSTTYDADGEITSVIASHEVAKQSPTQEEFKSVLKNFIGEILQTPPIFSALKINGKRACDRVRAGENVELKPRKVTISKIEIQEWNWPLVRLKVNCGKGTYIRSLAHDLGQALGCGGYVKELRRTCIGDFSVDNAQKLKG